MASTEMIVPGIYRHYKNRLYEVLDCARHTESEEALVIYRALYGRFELWARPLSLFSGCIEVEGKTRSRFELVRPYGSLNNEIRSS